MTTPKEEVVTVVGAGLMGHGIAQLFAAQGHRVWLIDTDEQVLRSATSKARDNLLQMAEHGIRYAESAHEIVDRITPSTELGSACEAADFVIEAVFEDLPLKREVFAELDRLCPRDAVLCSNTSVIRITEIAQAARHRDRIVGTHFWNPPYLIPLVEVVRADETADWALDAAYNLLQNVGKRPVRVHKDVPGFVGNRLQHALWREAFSIIDQGICEPGTVDEVIRNGFGLRLPVLGPVENADLIGLDLTLSIHDYILRFLNADPTPSKTLRERVEAGDLGVKSGKGFLAWNQGQAETTRQRLQVYLAEKLAEQEPTSRKEA